RRHHHARQERGVDLRRALEHAPRRHLRRGDRVHALRSRPRLRASVAAVAKPHEAPQRSEPHGVGAGAMTTPALEVAHLSKRFGGLPATKDVSLSVSPGERRLIIGPNGAGKTTLFNLITGDLSADAGSVRLFGQELIGMPTQRRVHLGLARTYQILTLFPRERLVHNLVLALLGLGRRRWDPRVPSGRRPGIYTPPPARPPGGPGGAPPPSGSWRSPPTASGAGSNSSWRWRRSRSCCCWTSRSPASRRPSGRRCAPCSMPSP